MGQHSSKPAGTSVHTRDGQLDTHPPGRSFRRLRSLSWASRPSSTRNKTARTRTIPEPSRRRSIFGTLFKDRRNSVHNESPVVQVSPASTMPELVEEPITTNETTSRTSNAANNHTDTMHAQPGTLMIVHGTMPADDGPSRATPDSSTLATSEHSSATPNSSQNTSRNEVPDSSAVADDRLQTSIDVLAALLSMATAATATSLLTGTTDILSTLSSDSPSGPQVSPTRARTAWDTLESLFYLRSDRESTISPHIQLFRDLALAVLSSRSSYAPRITPESRAGRIPLPPGSFERFLVELNANVRVSLRDDYVQRGSDATEASRRLNWWRAYQFPSVNVPQSQDGTSQAGYSRADGGNTSQPQTSRVSADGGSQPNTATATAAGNLVPVVIVGLRSLARDSNRRPSSTPSPPSPETTSGTGPSESGTPSTSSPAPQTPLPDEVDAITSSYVIIVLGGHYPPEHRYASATGSDDSNELDMLWDLVELVPFKPRTATADELSKSGLTCFKASDIPKMKVAENTAENCLICLEEYAEDAEVRLLGCTHAFHRSCVDRWLTEGQNGCPLCRAQGVPR